jgi:acetoin utilization deacetylase AcuC-like enzyme
MIDQTSRLYLITAYFLVFLMAYIVPKGVAAWLYPTRRYLSCSGASQTSVILRNGPSISSARRWTASVSAESPSSTHRRPARPFFPIYYNDVYEVKLPKNHRFPMEKYGRVRQLVQQWLQNLPVDEQGVVNYEFRVSPLSSIDELTTTHDPAYVQRFLTGDQDERELRNVGFPWSQSNVDRSLSSTGGTVAAACAVVQARLRDPYGLHWGAHVAGGTHHAFYDRGEGFCVFSDMAVAANVVMKRYPDIVRRILFLDLDVHQGNGNALLFRDNDSVFTFSLHCSANYFSEKQNSDLDIELPPECSDETYLLTLKHWLNRIEREAEPFDLVFFQAGVDVLAQDRLGRMSLTPVGVQRRNQLVYEFCASQSLPLVICMGGGYPKNQDWMPTLVAHANVYYQAHQFLAAHYKSSMKEQAGQGTASVQNQKLGL